MRRKHFHNIQDVNGRKKLKLNARSIALGSQFAEAAADGDIGRIDELAAMGASINFQNRDGETALSYAAAWNKLKSAKRLLDLGADPNIGDEKGGTPLMLAAQHGSLQFVKLLLAHGADPSAKDKAGNTVPMHANWRLDDRAPRILELILDASERKSALSA